MKAKLAATRRGRPESGAERLPRAAAPPLPAGPVRRTC